MLVAVAPPAPSVPVVAPVLLVVLLWYVLNYTAWGRRLYAVGDDPDAAELAGVPVSKMLITTYTLSGLICGFAGWVLIGRIGSVSPTAGEFANIESITAVVIGGISLFGGRGSRGSVGSPTDGGCAEGRPGRSVATERA